MKFSVIGLGKLGSPMAACFAARGHTVIGVDVNEKYVADIAKGKAPVFEPQLQEMLDQNGGRLSATTSIADAVRGSDVTFMIVPTPSGPDGAFTPKFALAAAESIAQVLRGKDSFHVVVVTSTVMPGCTGGEIKPLLERVSGKKCGIDFGLCYSPEFISLGSVVRDFLNPDFILIGESDKRSGDILSSIYKQSCDNDPPVARMTWVNAELTKIALNSFVTTKISYANMLAEMCERLEGGHVDSVTAALGLDSRIGPKYLKGSIGFGGPCFPRDNVALMTLAKSLGVVAPLPEATDRINHHQVGRLEKIVAKHLPKGGTLGILGLSYKPQTNVVEKSQGVEIAAVFANKGTPVVVFDPCAMDTAKSVLPHAVRYAGSASECARQADVLLICTPSREYKAISAADMKRANGRATIIDCWRMLDQAALSKVANYVGIGTWEVSSLAADHGVGNAEAA